MRRLLAVLLVLVATGARAGAADHLEPEQGTLFGYSEYDALVRRVLLAGIHEAYAQAVVLPAFDPEWVLVVHPPEAGRARLELRIANQQIWRELQDGRPPPSFTARTGSLESSTAETVAAAWELLLRGTRYPQRGTAGADGVTYHFARWVQFEGVLSGQVWSPVPDSRTGRLVQLLESLRALAAPEGSALRTSEESIRGQAKALVESQP